MRTLLAVLLLSISAFADDFLPGAKRIVFLGDSITYSGQYIDYFEAHLLEHFPARKFDVLDLGLSSETVSGLSEEGHADGKFPRPDLHERLTRVLEKTKPDLVFACYGMNDGIYLPLAEDRFAAFQNGMRKLHDAVTATGAKIIHLTPPVFDVEPIKARATPNGSGGPYVGYGEVLARYSAWLLDQRAQGWTVIDIHTPMREALAKRRAADPSFAFAKDGVHPNEEGHQVIAKALLAGLRQNPELPTGAPDLERLKLIQQRRKLRQNAWLTACGHLRPGVAKGLPVEEAEAKAAEITARLR
jgi:lysophospholipase L1-like esterase